MLVTLLGIVMLVSPLQRLKAQGPILVTLLGIVTLVSPLQPKKVDTSMLVTLLGIVMPVSPLQPSKALSPILVTLLGIVILVSLLNPAKPDLEIPVTGTTRFVLGSVTALGMDTAPMRSSPPKTPCTAASYPACSFPVITKPNSARRLAREPEKAAISRIRRPNLDSAPVLLERECPVQFRSSEDKEDKGSVFIFIQPQAADVIRAC
jgi:hypothetical protein